jgi:hypothetical protein
MKYKDLYKQTSEKEKLKFLDTIISNNPELQNSFMHFVRATNQEVEDLSFEQFVDKMQETYAFYLDHFESVDLEEPDWGSYTPSHSGYMDGWEQYQEASEQELALFFEMFSAQAIDLIITQDISELTAMIIGLYQAARDAVIDDPFETFDTVNDHLLHEHKVTMSQLTEKITLSAIADHAILQTTGLFFQYFSGSDLAERGNVTVFQDYLMALAGKTTKPEALLAQLDQSRLDRQDLPRLTLLLIGKAGDQTDWLCFARAYYKEDKEIASQLLEYYVESDQHEFVAIANELFDQNQGYWAPAISELVTPEMNMDLFIKVNYKLVTDEHELSVYLQIKPFLTQEMKERLLEDIDNYKPFKVQILEEEERFEEIRHIVEQNPASWDYVSLIRPILTVYPEFCFNHIRQKVLTTIATERGRSVYQLIVEWLQLADTIPGYQPQNRLLATELYNHKPSLPALKDELQKGGLV